MLELSEKVPSREVFSSPAPIPEVVREAMDALCLEVGEEHPPPSSYRLDGDLHPALSDALLAGAGVPCGPSYK